MSRYHNSLGFSTSKDVMRTCYGERQWHAAHHLHQVERAKDRLVGRILVVSVLVFGAACTYAANVLGLI